MGRNAEVAQLVERNLAKVEVAGSSLVFRSKKEIPFESLTTLAGGIFFVLGRSIFVEAPVAELVDAQDLKSCLPKGEYGFDSRLGHEGPSAMLRGFCIWNNH